MGGARRNWAALYWERVGAEPRGPRSWRRGECRIPQIWRRGERNKEGLRLEREVGARTALHRRAGPAQECVHSLLRKGIRCGPRLS